MNDSSITDWENMYSKLEGIYPDTSSQVVVNSALFNVHYSCLIKSAKDETAAMLPDKIIKPRKATYLQQAFKWGTRRFQGRFRRQNLEFRT